ncbi:MAG: redoxin domain-containing protein [Pyrinomonadaceae bacterium]|nr:redoxin domain-containing protein [Pyrinomonadaceae bacterium]
MSLQQRGRVRAAELTGGRGWLNTDKPLSLAALRGKIVLLDFWTYGCINCIHIIPDLKKLEAKYGNQLVVIGVHSAKFDNEKETDNIRRIILRYEIEHPVVNDADFKIWQAYGVRAWPTRVLIDPAGYVFGQVSGEGNYEGFDRIIGQLAEDFRKRGELNEQPLQLALERAKTADLPLAFPGKVLADAKGERLFIADSNHNRIVVTKLDGTLLDTIGTGDAGASDGSFEKATFYRPQGMSLDGDALYLADTENHLIRRIDLRTRTVSTVAGTGEQSRARDEAGPARSIALNSPWDLQLIGRTIFIAMAGPHQVGQLDLDKEQVSTFAGSGHEARTDGPRSEAAFAQPSGLASDGKTLFVADSESNIIRAIDLAPEGHVRTLAGGDLFKFGDREGRGDEARFQHPLGVVFTDGKLLIADTYNHKIKQLDPQTGVVKTFTGTGKPGQADGEKAAFYEPGGLSVANGKLFIADTNNHAIRTVDLRTKQATTLMIRGLRAPEESARLAPTEESAAPNAEEIKLPTQRLRASSDGTLIVDVALPEGYHLNESAPQRFKASVTNGVDRLKLNKDEPTVARSSKDLRLPLRLPVRALAPGQAELRVQLTLFYCREDNTGTCQIKTLVWRAPVEVTAGETAPREIRAQGQIKL